jgi:AcrR family transcriptional regulator
VPSPDSGFRRRRPTQERARITVDAILEAAADVFDAHGFEGGTTERIALRAGVSVGSMYQYFPTKSALLVALAERSCADMQARQRSWLARLDAEQPDLDAGLRGFVEWLVAEHADRKRLRCLLFEDTALPPELAHGMATAHGELMDGIARWLEGRVDQPRVAALMLYRTVPRLVHQFVLHPHDDLAPDVAAEEVFTMALAYLTARRS